MEAVTLQELITNVGVPLALLILGYTLTWRRLAVVDDEFHRHLQEEIQFYRSQTHFLSGGAAFLPPLTSGSEAGLGPSALANLRSRLEREGVGSGGAAPRRGGSGGDESPPVSAGVVSPGRA